MNEKEITALVEAEVSRRLSDPAELQTRLLYFVNENAKKNEEILRKNAELNAKDEALSIKEKELTAKNNRIGELLPKEAAYEAFMAAKEAISMRNVAGILNMPGWGRNKIFKFLRGKSVLDYRNIPYREYQERGYFRVVEQTWKDDDGVNHVEFTTLVYPKGVEFIRKLITQANAA
jgi:phage antirepressor YoqD-like protein